MGKAVQFSSEFALQKCSKWNNNAENQISQLPDEVLVTILSSLSMGEAARTSILSRRWRYLWTFFSGSLEFDGSETLFEIKWRGKSLQFERTRFVSWVNQVLRSHQGPAVDEFKVCFDIDNKCDIDNWIGFAFRKNIRKLELDLRTNVGDFRRDRYIFPAHLLEISNLGFLTSLRLANVNVTGEDLEYLLSHSPFLEVVSVKYSKSLVSLNVSGPSLKLKYLEIHNCYNLQNLEISAENLISFRYVALKTRFPLERVPFKHVPSLVEVSLEGDYSMHVMRNLCSFSSYFMQLERLALFLETNEAIFPQNIPILGNLKYLELSVSFYNRESLLSCMSLLDATPSLHEFTLKVGPEGESSPAREFIPMVFEMTRDDNAANKYGYLKVVKLVGCVGSVVVEFMACLLEHVVSLEKVIINPRIAWWPRSPHEYELENEPMYELAREHARKLVPLLSPGVEFIIH